MLDEFQKSVKAVLYDKLTSPLTGTFFFSWFAWNWKLIYYIILGDNERNIIERIEYIENNFLSPSYTYTVLYPMLTAILLILVYPFITTFAYWVTLIFRQWKKKIKNEIEKNRLLTPEESFEIRNEIEKQGEKYIRMTKNQTDGIKKLNNEIEFYKNKIKELEKESKTHKKKIKLTNKTYKDEKLGDDIILSVDDRKLNGKNYKEIKTYNGQTFLLSEEDLQKQIKE